VKKVSRAAAAAVLALAGSGCGHRSAATTHLPPADHGAPDAGAGVASAYERMGLIDVAGAYPCIGRVAFLADAVPDSTWTVIALAFARRPLRTADTRVTLVIARDGAVVRQLDGTLRDAWPIEDRVVFQRALLLAPGGYTLSVTIRDTLNVRASRALTTIRVPQLGEGTLSSAIPVYRATARYLLGDVPALLMNPRGTATAGRDSAITLYLEAYGAESENIPLILHAVTDSGAPVWREAFALRRRGELFSGETPVPVSRIGPGITTLIFTGSASGDTTPVFVGLGEGIAQGSYASLLDVLRDFTTRETLDSLRRTPPASRPAAWAAFTATRADSLRAYLARVRVANERFGDGGAPGWQTDRGRVYITLGDPYQIFMRGGPGRQQIWAYDQYLTRMIFDDATGHGQWRLTARSAADFTALMRRLRRPSP
jgi:GWxTD domain-containing protein